MSGRLHQAAGRLDDSRASLASYARVIAELWEAGREPHESTRAQVIAEARRFREFGAALDAVIAAETQEVPRVVPL